MYKMTIDLHQSSLDFQIDLSTLMITKSHTMITQVFLAAAIVATGLSFTLNDCPSHLPRDRYLVVHEDKCYQFWVTQEEEIEDAKNYCKDNGGELARVKTKSVNDFIKSMIWQYRHSNAKVWIGEYFYTDFDGFRWDNDDESQITYENFEVADEAKYDNDCIFMDIRLGKWFTHDCEFDVEHLFKHNFVCEYPIATKQNHDMEITLCPNSTRGEYQKVYDNKCYRFRIEDSDYKNVVRAQYECEVDGGTLAMVKSEQVNNFIKEQLHHTNLELWIGLLVTTQPSNTGYVWIDKSSFNTSSFQNFENDGYPGYCVSIESFGHWYNDYCENEKHYICEYPASNTTEKPTNSYVFWYRGETTHKPSGNNATWWYKGETTYQPPDKNATWWYGGETTYGPTEENTTV